MSGNIGEKVDVIASKVIELPVIDSVGKGIWKTINYEKQTVYIEVDNNIQSIIEKMEPIQ